MNESDLLVMPTYYPAEGHPWVIVEALAAGLPVISTDQGAISESVIDGVNGYLVDKRDAGAVAAKIRLLSDDSAMLDQMSARSRALYIEQFTEARMVARLADAFRATIENRKESAETLAAQECSASHA